MRRDVFQAIADPTRREIIGMLSRQKLNVNQVSDQFDVSRTAVSKHLRILRECGLITIEKKGRERYFNAHLESLVQVSDWVAQYRSFWNANLDRLESLLKTEDQTSKQDENE